MAKVKKIPATISRVTAEPLDSAKKRRVAGYARVSTDLEEQQTSYEAQKKLHDELSDRIAAVKANDKQMEEFITEQSCRSSTVRLPNLTRTSGVASSITSP